MMSGSATSASLSASAAGGGMGIVGGGGSQQTTGGSCRPDSVSMGNNSGQSYELIKSTQVRAHQIIILYLHQRILQGMPVTNSIFP